MTRVGNRQIADQIDKDKDAGVSLQELSEWISAVVQRRLAADVEERWKTHGEDDSLELYLQKNYGLLSTCNCCCLSKRSLRR